MAGTAIAVARRRRLMLRLMTGTARLGEVTGMRFMTLVASLMSRRCGQRLSLMTTVAAGGRGCHVVWQPGVTRLAVVMTFGLSAQRQLFSVAALAQVSLLE